MLNRAQWIIYILKCNLRQVSTCKYDSFITSLPFQNSEIYSFPYMLHYTLVQNNWSTPPIWNKKMAPITDTYFVYRLKNEQFISMMLMQIKIKGFENFYDHN